MKEYALSYVEYEGSVLLIEKLKPDWQKGRINLPGGSLDMGEWPERAAARELHEEANLLAFHVVPMGVIDGPDWRVHVIKCLVKNIEQWASMTDEAVFWMPINDALQHKKLIPNLRVIVPLCHCSVRGWVISGEEDDINLKITLPSVVPVG